MDSNDTKYIERKSRIVMRSVELLVIDSSKVPLGVKRCAILINSH